MCLAPGRVLQEDDTLGSYLACGGIMLWCAERAVGAVAVHGGAEDKAEDA